MYNTIPAILTKRQKQLRRRPAEERVMTPAEARDLAREMGAAQGTTCPDCGKEQMTNGLIAWCENAHVFKARKTMLIRAAPQNDGKCKSCAAAIVRLITESGKPRAVPARKQS